MIANGQKLRRFEGFEPLGTLFKLQFAATLGHVPRYQQQIKIRTVDVIAGKGKRPLIFCAKMQIRNMSNFQHQWLQTKAAFGR